MKPLCLFALSILLCTCVLGAQEASPPDAQALTKPVTLAVKGEALSDVMAMLGKQTGLKLRVTKDIADQKATIFVDNKPLKDVLDSLATIFGYRLSVVKQTDGSKVYELWESPKTKLAREAATTGAEAAAWQEMDKRIREIAASTPTEQKQCQQELKQLLARCSEKGSVTPEENTQAIALNARFGPAVALARFYTKLSPVAIQALQAHASVYLDTDTSEAEWRLPQDVYADLVARATSEDNPSWTSRPPAGCNIQCMVAGSVDNAPRDMLAFMCFCTVWPPEGDRQGKSPGPSACLSPGVAIGDAAPEQQVKLPNADDDGTLAKQVTFTAKELADEADLYGQTEKSPRIFVTRSDILSLLHRKMGVQSISDYHSYWFAWDAQISQTVKEVLDHLPEMIARSAKKDQEEGRQVAVPKSNPMWGWDGTCVQMRERFPYKLDEIEIPNRTIRRLRTNLAQNRYLDFGDAAEAAALTIDQSGELIGKWDRLIKVRGVDYRSSVDLFDVMTALSDASFELYAHLTDVQKRAVMANGLRASDLMPSQLDDFVQCLGALPGEHPKEGERRVGIYKYGIRVDKPQPDSTMSALIRLVRRESENYICPVPGTLAVPLKAQSPEDARQQFLKQFPDLDKRPHFFGRDMGYVMILLFPDGTTKERPIKLYAPVTLTK